MLKIRSVRQAAALVFAAALLGPVGSQAAENALRPGEYVTEGGWGIMTISVSKDRKTHFSLDAVGANAHICNLEGEVRDLQSRIDVDEPGKLCVVTFSPTPGGIDVASLDSETCRYFCGMRAHFEGEYLALPPECKDRERTAARERFKRLYDAKSYAKASETLEKLLNGCSKTLSWLDAGWIRNDLAITQYHLGRLADCRKTLEPLTTDAAKTEEELRKSLPPSDFDAYLPIAKATWHNSKLCAQERR